MGHSWFQRDLRTARERSQHQRQRGDAEAEQRECRRFGDRAGGWPAAPGKSCVIANGERVVELEVGRGEGDGVEGAVELDESIALSAANDRACGGQSAA